MENIFNCIGKALEMPRCVCDFMSIENYGTCGCQGFPKEEAGVKQKKNI